MVADRLRRKRRTGREALALLAGPFEPAAGQRHPIVFLELRRGQLRQRNRPERRNDMRVNDDSVGDPGILLSPRGELVYQGDWVNPQDARQGGYIACSLARAYLPRPDAVHVHTHLAGKCRLRHTARRAIADYWMHRQYLLSG